MTTVPVRKLFSIDDLPAFSPWPARLLGLDSWKHRKKTAAEVIREFDQEKWGVLLERVRTSPVAVNIDDVERWSVEGVPDSLVSIGDRLELLSPIQARRRYLALIESVLRRYLPAAAVAELGAGYGSVILQLARRPRFAGVPLLAGEYAERGCELIRQLSQASGLRIVVGHCDLGSRTPVDFAVPEGALLFTSMAVHYVPRLSEGYVHAIAALRPAAVVNVEPCYEHCSSSTLTGLLRRRYIEINDYNRNLMSVLRAQQAAGTLRIVEEIPAVIGINPLLPVSVVVWVPER